MGIMQMLMSGGGPGAMEATGGTKSYTPTHTIHTFLTNSPFVVSSPGLVQILVVAGGGSGGPRHGGGGGAGGLIHLPGDNGSLANGTYNVVIGDGGVANPGAQLGVDGDDSSFGPPSPAAAPTHLLALGGGAGGKYPGNGGVTGGGSGGGAGGVSPGTGGSGSQPAPTVYGTSTGHGNMGGTGYRWGNSWPGPSGPATNDKRKGAGGGGAGGVGAPGGEPGGSYATWSGSQPIPAPALGDGGVGLQVQIAPNGPNIYYAAGGGGGTWGYGGNAPQPAGDGGQGGGGGGADSSPTPTANIGSGGSGGLNAGGDGTSGLPNTGGAGGTNTGSGGGGNGQSAAVTHPTNPNPYPTSALGGDGGPGIVIISYQTG